MRILGELSLQIAFVATGFAAFLHVLAGRRGAPTVNRLGALSAWLGSVALLVVTGVLLHALGTRDYAFEYVVQYTSNRLPWRYCLSALWVGQAGSLLVWATFSALLAAAWSSWRPATARRQLTSGLLLVNTTFLIAVLVFAADPMAASLTPRQDGLGLSPLLQHPSMLIHPPIVFLAYALWSVPCALALAALLTGEVDEHWLRQARPWSLAAWLTLGAGLLLGAHWAYQELGWGGYWGWDPVENGSLIPWLTGTALVHAGLVWKSHGGLKKSALLLACGTFALCSFATFLTRSGIFSSVHAFSQSPIGWMFLGQMLVIAGIGSWLVMRHRRALQPLRPISGFVARESLALVSVYLLLLLAGVVTIGTLFAPLSKLIAGRTVQVGPEFYNYVFAPLGVAILAATAMVPLLRWNSRPTAVQRRALAYCLALAVCVVVVCLSQGVRHPLGLVVAGLAALAVFTTLASWWLDARRLRVLGPVASPWEALRRHRIRYAAYTIHLGLAAIGLGIAGSALGHQRIDVELEEGQTLDWAGRRIEYVQLVQRDEPDRLVAEIELRVSRGNGESIVLRPARHLHTLQNEWTTEVAIDSSWSGDFYTVLNAGLGEGRVQVTLVHNPLLRWLWFGGWLAAAATGVAAWPPRRRTSEQIITLPLRTHTPSVVARPARRAA